MKIIKYACTHCGRKFEAEEKESVECPGCFWSSSVKKEEELQDIREKSEASPASFSQKSKTKPAPSFAFLKDILAGLRLVALPAVILAVVIGLLVGNWSRIEKFLKEREDSIQAKKIDGRAGVKRQNLDPGLIGLGALSEEEKIILSRRVEVTADRLPTEAESKILSSAAPLNTGIVERLPTQAWTLENFKQTIAEQERFYKVPLPGSYKDKLEDVFKKSYLPGEEAFKAGDLIKARDLWVEALALPVYSKDIHKHRGVALTMLRPFINDTLSKIGAINGTLVEQKIREKEKELVENVQELQMLIQKKFWAEASAMILKIEETAGLLENPQAAAGTPAPYPAAFSQIDEGIRTTLAALLAPPPPAIADLEPLTQDMAAKKKVIESFLTGNVEASQRQYDEGLESIKREDWLEAEKIMRQIDSPLALFEDAQEKVKVLKKIQKAALDSAPKPG